MRGAIVLTVLVSCLLGAMEARGDPRLTVVELFTSQGCSSCPPADAFLRELARRDDVLPLSQHVDYWDYLGWRDPFARPQATERQRAYAARFGLSYVYTPQMVIGGNAQATGSSRAPILAAIEAAARDAGPPVTIRRADADRLVVSIGAGGAAVDPLFGEADVWLVLFDGERTTDIARGENGGRRLHYVNVVRDFRRIGAWRGEPLVLPVAMPAIEDGGDECAVIVQQKGTGRILGAARLASDS